MVGKRNENDRPRTRRGRRCFVGLVVAAMAVGTVFVASPAGAAVSACTETNTALAQGFPSGLRVACGFTSAGVSAVVNIDDYDNAEWHAGAARVVSITEQRGQAGQPAGSTAGATHIHNTALSATNLPITNADTNHSIEGPGIAPGTFMRGINPGNGDVLLNLNTVAGGPACPGGAAACHPGGTTTVKVANSTDRSVKNGGTTFQSNVVTSLGAAGAHFCKPSLFGCPAAVEDTGARVSGGDLPDGATIASVDSYGQVTLECVGCVGGPGIGAFLDVTTRSNVVLSITRPNAPTSTRYVVDGNSSGGNKVLSSPTAEFAITDIGLPVTFNPPIPAVAGARIVSVAADGSFATLTSPANLPAGAKKFTIGVPTKNAPSNGSVVGQLTVELMANPVVFPSAPPCSAGKFLSSQIQMQWKNPGAYDLAVNVATYEFPGIAVPGTSVAQFQLRMASTTYAGYLKQEVTTVGGVGTTSGWSFEHTFLPVVVGLCSGTDLGATWDFNAMTVYQQQLPVYTGPEGESRVRGLRPEPQGTFTQYIGSTGAEVTSGATEQPSNANACTLTSPNAIFPTTPCP